ncbi:MAG: transketolase [Piscinibacter sp.]|uniref:transketolase n=1 Tax=Piscinibacter sp. TaxID=1903157 RepID=UPI001B5E63C9|nr:transketolase [Piscinibacter sp.]MBP5988912.1 transketolase [Piscinibacter sp.]MBP6026368.1 transketolase [Piscinibacter sp.]
MTTSSPDAAALRTLCANALRVLAIDAVQAANSGHPGMPMGMADIAEALWRHHLKHDPADPQWLDRDRFVLSNGHGSMLLYALLHLSGYALPMGELKRFRQLHSLTPGHPEHGLTPGVETTTGPLGQGISNAVGMALAEKLLAAEFNKPGHTVIDHRTWVFLGDGCLMEGISHEACSLAGTWRLNKLVAFYDDNGISIDGDVKGWFRDDTPARFEAYGWTVIRNVDGHDRLALDAAIEAAKSSSQPVLICCRTQIGHGSPNRAGTAKAHGEALGAEEIKLTRERLGWRWPAFEIPQDVREAWSARERGAQVRGDWQRRFGAYAEAHPDRAHELLRRHTSTALPAAAEQALAKAIAETEAKRATVATRKASQELLNAVAPALPELLGGSADLTGSNLTDWKGHKPLLGEGTGNHVHYGVREFGMAAIMNGVALHGGLRPYGGTFLTFSDYSRNALRMSALMKLPVVHVFTHDSIGLGEDGPTHQPVEHVSSLRLVPGLDVWRPADATETAVAWRQSLRRADGPSVLALSRQGLPHAAEAGQERSEAIARGAYVLRQPEGEQLVLIATGSEVQVALAAAALLAGEGIAARVVSVPCLDVFERQDESYRAEVIPRRLPRLAVEAGSSGLWWKYVGENGDVVGLDRFGESAPAGDLFRLFGITAEMVAVRATRLVGAARAPREAVTP